MNNHLLLLKENEKDILEYFFNNEEKYKKILLSLPELDKLKKLNDDIEFCDLNIDPNIHLGGGLLDKVREIYNPPTERDKKKRTQQKKHIKNRLKYQAELEEYLIRIPPIEQTIGNNTTYWFFNNIFLPIKKAYNYFVPPSYKASVDFKKSFFNRSYVKSNLKVIKLCSDSYSILHHRDLCYLAKNKRTNAKYEWVVKLIEEIFDKYPKTRSTEFVKKILTKNKYIYEILPFKTQTNIEVAAIMLKSTIPKIKYFNYILERFAEEGLSQTDAVNFFMGVVNINISGKKLNLPSVRLEEKGLKELFECLIYNKNIKELMLENNINITSKGFAYLASFFTENNTIENFTFQLNNLIIENDINDFKNFVYALNKNKSLQYLCLDSCGLDSISAKLLAGALKNNIRIKYLNLNNNDLFLCKDNNDKIVPDISGVKAIIESLKFNRNLEELYINTDSYESMAQGSMNLDKEFNKLLSESLQYNFVIHDLDAGFHLSENNKSLLSDNKILNLDVFKWQNKDIYFKDIEQRMCELDTEVLVAYLSHIDSDLKGQVKNKDRIVKLQDRIYTELASRVNSTLVSSLEGSKDTEMLKEKVYYLLYFASNISNKKLAKNLIKSFTYQDNFGYNNKSQTQFRHESSESKLKELMDLSKDSLDGARKSWSMIVEMQKEFISNLDKEAKEKMLSENNMQNCIMNPYYATCVTEESKPKNEPKNSIELK